jgi:hypothetical protein
MLDKDSKLLGTQALPESTKNYLECFEYAQQGLICVLESLFPKMEEWK